MDEVRKGGTMKNLRQLDKYRVVHLMLGPGDETCGTFKVFIEGKAFFVIASSDGGWEHVSVTMNNRKLMRCPTWEEMCAIKDMFFDPEEVVMQLHPKHSEYINNHPYCLHLWRPTGNQQIPTPPSWMVGI